MIVIFYTAKSERYFNRIKKNVTQFIHLYIAFLLKNEKKKKNTVKQCTYIFHMYVVKCLKRARLSIDRHLNVFVKVVFIK